MSIVMRRLDEDEVSYERITVSDSGMSVVDVTQRVKWVEALAPAPDVQRHQQRGRKMIGSHNGYDIEGRRDNRRDIGRLSAAQCQAELADALDVLEAELADTIEAEFEAQRLAELAAAAQPPVPLRRALARPRGRVIVERENGEVERYG